MKPPGKAPKRHSKAISPSQILLGGFFLDGMTLNGLEKASFPMRKNIEI